MSSVKLWVTSVKFLMFILYIIKWSKIILDNSEPLH